MRPTASSAVPASPTTTRSSSASRISRTPRRTTSWSSRRKTRMETVIALQRRPKVPPVRHPTALPRGATPADDRCDRSSALRHQEVTMTTTTRTEGVTPNATSASPLSASAASLGLPSATALVIGSIIGTGVFTMPAVMAGAGTSSILTLSVIAVGALLLGIMFGQLTKRIPHHEGGLYAYARHEF